MCTSSGVYKKSLICQILSFPHCFSNISLSLEHANKFRRLQEEDFHHVNANSKTSIAHTTIFEVEFKNPKSCISLHLVKPRAVAATKVSQNIFNNLRGSKDLSDVPSSNEIVRKREQIVPSPCFTIFREFVLDTVTTDK